MNTTQTKEKIAKAVFLAFAAFSILAVFIIIGYLLYASVPAFREIGVVRFLFGRNWNVKENDFAVGRLIVGTLFLTLCSVLLGGFAAVFTAVWLVFYCPKKLKKIYTQIINLLAGIPSIIYGLFGYQFVMPTLVEIFHPTNAGFGLLASTIILSVMILPTVASITKNSLEAVPAHYFEGALALGCTKNQAVWRVLVPAAKSGIVSALILGIGRAVGETMAVQMIVGNGTGFPLGAFIPFTTLTSNIVQNWGYAEVWDGNIHSFTQQNALFACGFILLIVILVLNLCLGAVKKDSNAGNRWFSRRLEEGNVDTASKTYKHTGSAQDVLWILSWMVAVFTAFLLVFIVLFVFIKGFPHLNANFLFGESSNAGITLVPAVTATFMLIGLALVIALPLGIGAAIYLNEYAKKGSRWVRCVRLFTDTLAGIPSIIFGIFGYALFVSAFGMGYSLTAGGITLALIVLPTVIRSAEQSLSEVPDSMREASYALGAGKLRTIVKVVLPRAVAGIVTSVILSVGRIVNESAALIFTAGSAATFIPQGYGEGTASLAVLVWKFMSNGLNVNEAFATASVLLVFVILLNLLVTLVEHLYKRRNRI